MNIAELIAALQAGQDPSTAIPGAFAAAPTGVAEGAIPHLQSGSFPFPPAAPAEPPAPQAQAQAPTAPPGPPVGVPSPVTNPQPPGTVPTVTQSPPDLANMYIELMKQNQNARSLDSGLSLIAAGLSPYQASRTALIGLAGQEEKGKMGLSAADIINFQKQNTEMQQRALRQKLLPALAKEHRLTPETIAALEASGKLDEVLQNFATKGLTHVKDDATGDTIFFNRHGEEVTRAKGGLKPTDDQRELDKYNAGRPPEQQLDMKQWLSTVKRAEPAATDLALRDTINAERKAKGLEPITTEEFLTKYKHPKTEINVSADGTNFPKLPEGEDYIRNPDGKVRIFEDGKPRTHVLSKKVEAGIQHTEEQTAALQQKEIERQKKENKARVAATISSTAVGAAVDKALVNADAPGASGVGSRVARTLLPLGGMSWDTLDANLKTITSQATVTALNEMRAASQSGAALGNVSDFENKMLAATIADVTPFQSTAQLKESLIRLKAQMMVMAENKYENEGDAARYQKDLKERIAELTADQAKAAPAKRGVKVREVPKE